MLVLREVNAGVFLEFSNHPVDDLLVKVVAAEFVVSSGGLDFDLRLSVDFVNLKHRNVECPATQIVDQNGLVLAFVDAVGKGCGRGFVDDTKHLKTCNSACVLGRFSLCVREVGRAGDDRLGHFMAEVGFCIGLEFLQNKGRNLLWRVRGFIDIG